MHEFLIYPILFSIIHNRVEILYEKKVNLAMIYRNLRIRNLGVLLPDLNQERFCLKYF